jgi:hypothetical protein
VGSIEQQFSNNRAIAKMCLNNGQSAQVKSQVAAMRAGYLLFTAGNEGIF